MIILSERESPFALALLRGLTNITLKQINHSKFYLAFPCKFHDMRRIPAGQNGKETDGQVSNRSVDFQLIRQTEIEFVYVPKV